MSKKTSEHRKLFRKSTVAEAISVAVMATMISAPVFSAEETEEETEVIYVTATKKSETIQEVPLAVTALTGDFMEKVHLSTVKDIISYSPGVNGRAQSSFLDSVSVRGVRTDDYGAGGDGSLSFFKNDQFEGRSGSAVSSIYDMDRAEIVNGPQGFLFGRNAIGGAVSVHTKRAEIDFFDANLDFDIGDFGLAKISGAINVPVNDNFAMRFAGQIHQEEAYTKNMNPDQPLPDTDTKAVRWSTTFQKDDLSIYTMVEYEDRNGAGGMYRLIEEGEIWDEYNALWGVGNRGEARDVDINSHWGLRDETQVLNLQLRIEQEFDLADLTINAAYKEYDYWYSEQWIPNSIPDGSWAVDQAGDYAQVELRLNSKGDGPLSWYVGTSLYKENLEYDTLNTMTEEFQCAYYNGIYNYYYPGSFESLSGATTGHCQNYADNWAAYYGYPSSYYAHLTEFNRADGLIEEVSKINAVNSGWAAYANISYEITDTINVEFGVRHTVDNKEFANQFSTTGSAVGNFYNVSNSTAEPIYRENEWDDTSYKYLIRWKPSDTMMLYTSYTEGYKSGGFTSYAMEDHDGNALWGDVGVTNANARIPMFGPEFVESIEVGYKDTWLDDTDVRVTLYSYEYGGLQVTKRSEDGGAVIIENLGVVKSQGIEAATNTTLTDNWSLMFNFHYIDSEAYGIQDQCGGTDACEGDRLYWTPDFSGAAVLDGYFPLESGAAVTVSLETYWESEHGGGFEQLEPAVIDASQTWNARLGYIPDSNWYVEAYVDNLTDEINYASSYNGNLSFDGNGGGAYPATTWAVFKPRSFGIRFGMSWE